MSQPVGRYPSGFLGLVNSKSRGQTPATYLDEVRTVIDLSPYYLLNSSQRIDANTSVVTALGTWGAGTFIARGQAGVVHSISIRTTGGALGAGTTYGGVPYISWVDETTYAWLGELRTFTAGLSPAWGWEGAIYVRGPVSAGLFCSQFAAGVATAMRVNVSFSVWDD